MSWLDLRKPSTILDVWFVHMDVSLISVQVKNYRKIHKSIGNPFQAPRARGHWSVKCPELCWSKDSVVVAWEHECAMKLLLLWWWWVRVNNIVTPSSNVINVLSTGACFQRRDILIPKHQKLTTFSDLQWKTYDLNPTRVNCCYEGLAILMCEY